METVTQQTIQTIVENWSKAKITLDKANAVIEDLGNCKNDYTLALLVTTLSKILESVGMKEKIFPEQQQ